jgi:hypothetical protein
LFCYVIRISKLVQCFITKYKHDRIKIVLQIDLLTSVIKIYII